MLTKVYSRNVYCMSKPRLCRSLISHQPSRVILVSYRRFSPPPIRSEPRNVNASTKEANLRRLYQCGTVILTFIGLSFLAVPLYELVCTRTGLDGTPRTLPGSQFSSEDMKPVKNALPITIKFASSVSSRIQWKFTPVTREIQVVPGETALGFFSAENNSNEDIVGISTYSVVPAKAAQYFNKIQCFCFEEQLLKKGEQVDMPVFFYIDPEFAFDPFMRDVREITLHYTFFKSKVQPEQYGLLRMGFPVEDMTDEQKKEANIPV